jgi:predicted enzyme related to lactoylglutathione lyase
MSKELNPVGWFEIPVRDLARAKAFYEYVFAIKLDEHQIGPLQMAWLPMNEDAVGASGSLVKGNGYDPSFEGVLIYFTAPDIEATLSRSKEKGGKVIAEKTRIGEYGFIALIQDTEGNRIGLHSRE